MMNCGLLGRKLAHSYSPQIHACFGDYPYQLFEKEPDEIRNFLMDGSFTGINVTIPYKKDVIPYCNELTETARKMGAVNTIVRKDSGKLIGHNTDHFGFSSMVSRSGLCVRNKKILVLGSGGASVTAQKVLLELGATVVVISRTGENNYQNLHLHKDAAVIVNCTPVGMYPNNGISPVDISEFPILEGVLDMIYNPARTQLLMDAEAKGIVAMNGLWMLVAQAKESAEWFLERPLPDDLIEKVYYILKNQMENIILVGMPGCGKSTVAMLLADALAKPSVDADCEIEAFAEHSIPEIFAQGGESAFRGIETKVLSNLGKRSGLILATGGGCVTREENYPLLHQNGTIIWLQRALSSLPSEGRPLSMKTKMEDMYLVREPMYRRFADIIICNDGSPQDAALAIMRALGEST